MNNAANKIEANYNVNKALLTLTVDLAANTCDIRWALPNGYKCEVLRFKIELPTYYSRYTNAPVPFPADADSMMDLAIEARFLAMYESRLFLDHFNEVRDPNTNQAPIVPYRIRNVA
jgi:hypothetical protein